MTDTTTDKKALHAVTKARTVLIVSNPFYGSLALQLQLVQCDEDFCDTMAVDGIHMYYYPPFVLSLKEDELVGVVAHETTHCAYQHMTRRGNRHPLMWNCAGDYVINQDLRDAGFILPGKPSHTVQPGSRDKVHLIDPKYKGMSTEEVYARLHEDAEKRPQQGGCTLVMPGQGNGQGQDQGQDGPKHQDPGMCGGVIDAAAPHDKAKAEEIQSTWEANVRMAVAVATANNAGRIPGHLERLVGQLKKPRVSWRDETNRFIDYSMTKDFSYARPNRRSASAGVLMPGYVSDRMHHLVCVCDDSGSITNEVITEMVGEAAGALDQGVADMLTILYADAEVHDIDEYTAGDLVVARKIEGGGGGTAFRDSFDYIRRTIPDASCVIYLTDLCTSDWGEEPDCPVLWAAYLTDSAFASLSKQAPFGQVIQVPKY